MKKFLIQVVMSSALCIAAVPVYAGDARHSMAEAQPSYAAKGEVVAVDKAAGRVKIKHEAISGLGWPAMTMFFQVDGKVQLEAVKPGDRVEFQLVKSQGGAVLITQMKPVK